MSAESVESISPTPGELVAAEVRAVAARKRITGVQMAAALDISPMSMSRRTTGRQPFDVDELFTVARVLGVPVERLLPHLDSNQEPTGYHSNGVVDLARWKARSAAPRADKRGHGTVRPAARQKRAQRHLHAVNIATVSAAG